MSNGTDGSDVVIAFLEFLGKMWSETLAFLARFWIALSILAIAAGFGLGWLDVPGFEAVVDGFVSILKAVPGAVGDLGS